jgi:hypothetical protein
MKLGTQKLAFHINLLPYLNTLRADHTGNKGTVTRTEETELRLNTNQSVKTNFLPKICNYLSYMDYHLTNETVAVGPSKSCNLPNYTQPQAEDLTYTQKK